MSVSRDEDGSVWLTVDDDEHGDVAVFEITEAQAREIEEAEARGEPLPIRVRSIPADPFA